MATAALRTMDLTKHFNGTVALRNLDLEVAPGEVLGFLGPNGAGKTTAIRLVLGMLRPTAGRAEIFGLDSHRDTVAAHARLAYVPGEANLWPNLTGAETMHLLGRAQGNVDTAYRDELVERFALDPSKKVRAYSKGNRQKVVLIAALMSRADLLVLDEPTSGLDPLMEREFRHAVHDAKERGQAVFLSSHILSEVEALCDRIGILRSGELVEIGAIEQLRHLSALAVEITVSGDVPDLMSVDGVTAVTRQDETLRCEVRGPIEPLLTALRGVAVTKLISREPSLEELFLAHYGPGIGAGAGTDAADSVASRA
jgi:ABC-2 type transport system ATP-binding protein